MCGIPGTASLILGCSVNRNLAGCGRLEAVPADVLSSALYARFRSRQQHTFAEKMLSAVRFGFGGHIEGQESIEPEPKPDQSQGRSAASTTPRSSVMLESSPEYRRPCAWAEAPPRRQAQPADPCAVVIFGASGDLTKRLVVPAVADKAFKHVV
jgi:hypothetical protein